MYQNFTTAGATQHRSDPIPDARLMSPGHRVTYAKKLALATAFATLAIGGTAAATASPWQSGPGGSYQPGRPQTPNQCIRLNGGDYNACNVGNSGAGNKPYEPMHALTPNDCIRVNGGDYNACNVGNSGRGDLPYRQLVR
jgi:roadblock/LC7 domain-containing protein